MKLIAIFIASQIHYFLLLLAQPAKYNTNIPKIYAEKSFLKLKDEKYRYIDMGCMPRFIDKKFGLEFACSILRTSE